MIVIKRRVVLHGPSTLTISLPSKWIKRFNIKKGDELEIKEYGDMLRINTEKGPAEKKISLDMTDLDELTLWFILPVLHKSGYDEVEVCFNNPKIVKLAQDRINSMLLGYEIIEQTNKKCIIRNISTHLGSEFDNILRRIFLVTLSLAKNSLEAIKSGDLNNLNELLVLEQTINRLTNFSQRLLNKKPHEEGRTLYMYLIIWLLECIGDHYRDICNFLDLEKKSIKINKQVIKYYEEVNALLRDYYDLFYKYSFSKITEIRAKQRQLSEELRNLIVSAKNKNEIILITHLLGITQRIDDFLGSTVGLQYVKSNYI